MNVITETTEALEQVKRDRKQFLSGAIKPETEKVLARQRGQTIQLLGLFVAVARASQKMYGSHHVPFLPAPKQTASKKLSAAA